MMNAITSPHAVMSSRLAGDGSLTFSTTDAGPPPGPSYVSEHRITDRRWLRCSTWTSTAATRVRGDSKRQVDNRVVSHRGSKVPSPGRGGGAT